MHRFPHSRQEAALHAFGSAYGQLVTHACQTLQADGTRQHTRLQATMRARYHDARKQGITIDTLWQRAHQVQRAICAEHGIPTGAIPTYRLR